jgi:toxin-antitoxin system PIN domain toxin
MPASGGIKLADANVWLALVFSDHIHHATARTWFEAQGNEMCAFCRVTQMDLLRDLGNSKITGRFAQSQQDAWGIYDKLTQDPRVLIITETATLGTTFRSLTQADSPSHVLWTDAYLAAFSMESGAQLVTFDQGFSRFSGLDLRVLV